MIKNDFFHILQVRKRGSVLILSMVAIVVLFITGASLLELGLKARIFSIINSDGIQAQCAADSGLLKAVYDINHGLEIDLSDEESEQITVTENITGSKTSFSYTIFRDAENGYVIESTGICGNSTKKVYASLKSQGFFDYAIAVKENIVLKPGTYLDGYNFKNIEDKPELITKSTLPMQIILARGTTIDGNVKVGVGGDPEEIISAPEATITGEIGVLSNDIDFPSVNVPSWLLDLPSSGYVGDSITMCYSSRYSGINLGRGDIITIDGPVVLYISGDINLGNASEIVINKDNPDASLTIYLEGHLVAKNGGTINNLTEDPRRLKIFALDTCDQISLQTAGTFYGGIYAPNAMFNLMSSVELYGAFSTKLFIQGVSSNVHYDAALKEEGRAGQSGKYQIEKWWE